MNDLQLGSVGAAVIDAHECGESRGADGGVGEATGGGIILNSRILQCRLYSTQG